MADVVGVGAYAVAGLSAAWTLAGGTAGADAGAGVDADVEAIGCCGGG